MQATMTIAMIPVRTFPTELEDSLGVLLDVVDKVEFDILLAPEWYFLKRNKLYTKREKEAIKTTLSKATEGLESLIIPGTIGWEDGRHYHNTAFICIDGNVDEYTKQNAATSDMALCTKNHVGGIRHGKAPHYITWRGFDVAVQICRDYPCSIPKKKVDMQIIPACNLIFLPENLRLKEKGLYLKSDGEGFLPNEVGRLMPDGHLRRVDHHISFAACHEVHTYECFLPGYR
ncbi:hypothetical protein COV93_01550 [Candidatus Woesearchaeota archaeon CG11_big_fil_rev_8_21_14_0_20_43_8]|nr:MAG: hypothetical protein COV93_01550 [Candidatus Woesearchaeota archaeon CG11_big_fil_rev_8_21_14_0_20_43_8]PIO05462.1 MAG: hypothetical protein COT47_04710 [Candidatus Woesearchaeota archaeon CG08_land_8_20_14_0_20_43_7]